MSDARIVDRIEGLRWDNKTGFCFEETNALFKSIKSQSLEGMPDYQVDAILSEIRNLDTKLSENTDGTSNKDAHKLRLLCQCICVSMYYSEFLREKVFSGTLKILKASNGLARQLLAYELTYAEQGFREREQDKVFEALSEIIENENELEGCLIGNIRPVRDYFTCYDQRRKYKDTIKDLTKTFRSHITKVFSLHSLKGGTGKTLIAHTIANRILSKYPDKVVALVDIDYTGPSAQFLADIEYLNAFHCSKFRPDHFFDEIEYPNFWQTFNDIFLVSKENKPLEVNKEVLDEWKEKLTCTSKFERMCLRAQGNKNLRVILTSNNVVELPELQKCFGDFAKLARLTIFLDNLISYLAKSEGVTHVVIDNGPGLYGVQGFLIQYLSARGVHPLITSSNRIYDVFNTAYDVGWFLSRNQFPTSPIWLMNMYDNSKTEHPLEILNISGDADRNLPAIIKIFQDEWTYGRYILLDEKKGLTEFNSELPKYSNVFSYANKRLRVVTLPFCEKLTQITNAQKTYNIPSWDDVFNRSADYEVLNFLAAIDAVISFV